MIIPLASKVLQETPKGSGKREHKYEKRGTKDEERAGENRNENCEVRECQRAGVHEEALTIQEVSEGLLDSPYTKHIDLHI